MKSLGRISYAHCGFYNPAIELFLRSMGWEVVPPPKITRRTVQLGVSYSPEMICFPYKATLGNILELAEQGVDHFVTYNSQGFCRFTHFSNLYQNAFAALGKPIRLLEVDRYSLIHTLRLLSGGQLGLLQIAKRLWQAVLAMIAAETAEERTYANGEARVILVGEAYSLAVPELNFQVRDRLLKQRIATTAPALISHYFRKKFHLLRERETDADARRLLNGPISGCAFESLSSSLYAAKHGFDGIVHLYPLTCMPETTVKPLIETIARTNGLPLLTIEVDETLSHLNAVTRLETFAEMVRQHRRQAAPRHAQN
jgi:predicted nucleotide-binding protein (sugar kinase/HSP70/actin superfamily)